MKGKAMLLVGGAIGYVLGSKAGRRRYDQIRSGASKAWQSPAVQERAGQAQQFVVDKAPEVQQVVVDVAAKATSVAKDRLGGSSSPDLTADSVSSPDLAADVRADRVMHGGDSRG